MSIEYVTIMAMILFSLSFVKNRYEPVDIVFRLAEKFAKVVLNGSEFDATAWSAWVSLANLNTTNDEQINANLRDVVTQYVQKWGNSK